MGFIEVEEDAGNFVKIVFNILLDIAVSMLLKFEIISNAFRHFSCSNLSIIVHAFSIPNRAH